MESAHLEAFLKDAGYAYDVEEAQNAKRFNFKDRGCKFYAIANDGDPQFLYFLARFDLPERRPDAPHLQEIMRNLEDTFYVTNAHMVGEFANLTLYRQCPAYAKLLGTVIAKGDPATLGGPIFDPASGEVFGV